MARDSTSAASPYHIRDIITVTLEKIKRSHEELKYVVEALHESAKKKPWSERQITKKDKEVQDAMAHYKQSVDALERLIKSDDGRFCARNYVSVRPKLVVVLGCEKHNSNEYEKYFYKRQRKRIPKLQDWKIPSITK